MRRTRILTGLFVLSVTLLTCAAPAFASSPSGGQGWYGETNDKVITNAMFLVILFFPVIITLFSIIQWRLDKRKHARMDAAKRREGNADWRGGW
jgi:heme/copper-type cytochrome/quinol oxidase subunit 2